MEIPDIGVRNIGIPNVGVNPIFQPGVPRNFVIHPPITDYLAKPVVAYPGCVEHAAAIEDDQKIIRCDGEVPGYNAMDYTPENMVITKETPPPKTKTPDAPEVPEAPEVPSNVVPPVKKDEEVECPPPNAPRIGDVAQNQKERVSGFELQNGICVTLYEDIPWTAQYLPAPQVVATTGGIAVVATSSALLAKPLADLLLKVIKPAIKKVMAKISKLRGKKVKIESLRERRDQQRIRSHAIRKLKGKE